ncbi:Ribosomal protein L49/IMG2 [Phaffia rhodozyma]|uniref:Large ribosomal subunit protein mL49 n=1 Tax=Phaffia rhodozyma TaxID=264483 RepID=A0A0F7SR67_PHARH|nr:Ribosomal protein L49/IMG2 [Phaffia rhodozyma]
MFRSTLRPTLSRSFSTTPSVSYPRAPLYPPFQTTTAPRKLDARLRSLQDPLSPTKPRVSDPPRPDRKYPSELDQPLRKYAKPQRSKWDGPESDVRDFKGGKWAGKEGFLADPQFEGVENIIEQRGGLRKIKPSQVFVGRAKVSGFVPIYVDKRRTQPFTIIKQIQGDPKALLSPLLKYLTLKRPDHRRGAEGRIRPVTGEIEIKGAWKEEVREYLLSQGF